jgi:hypothetical protein
MYVIKCIISAAAWKDISTRLWAKGVVGWGTIIHITHSDCSERDGEREKGRHQTKGPPGIWRPDHALALALLIFVNGGGRQRDSRHNWLCLAGN